MTSCFVSLCRIFPCFFSDRISATWVLFVFGPPVGHGLLIHEVSRSHTKMHHSRKDSSGRVISSSQRPLPDNTQHSQQTDIHAPGGIRTLNLSMRAAADPRLRPRGHRKRLSHVCGHRNTTISNLFIVY